jgi:hypothetical protein
MSDTPVPLREALREAVKELAAAITDVEQNRLRVVPFVDRILRKAAAEERVASLLSQIPPDLEANDAE